VNLRLHPPADSVAWPADEPCQIQALTRTQSAWPCVPGHCATQTHGHPEWIAFLGQMEEQTPAEKQIHLILDPRFHIHSTPTSGSWLNPAKRLFGEVNAKPEA